MSFPENPRDVFGSKETMREFFGYARVSSPATATPIVIVSPTILDCSAKHIHLLAAPAAPAAYAMKLANMVEGQTINVVVASNGIAYTWSSWVWTFSSDLAIKWNPVGLPVPTTIAARWDLYSFIRAGNMVFGSVLLQMS